MVKGTDRIPTICMKCGAESTAAYDHWRKYKNIGFYCKPCAQEIRLNAMRKVTETDEYKEKMKKLFSESHPMHRMDDAAKKSWYEKTFTAFREYNKKRFLENDDLVRIFGTWEYWSSMKQPERAKVPVEVTCEDCGKKFNTKFEYYFYGKRKASAWRCDECRAIRNAKRAKEQDLFKHKEGSPYYHAWRANLSEEDLIDLHKRRLRNRSKLNKKFLDYFKNSYISNDFYVKEEELLSNDSVSHFWDFLIYRKTDDKLIMAVDVDGAYYHGDCKDYSFNHGSAQEDKDATRFQSVPKGVLHFIFYELQFTKSFEEMIKLLMVDYDTFVEKQFIICRNIPFPTPEYSTKELITSYNGLIKPISYADEKEYLKIINFSMSGMRLVNHFHPSIYMAKCEGFISPYDAWMDDDKLKDVIRNRIIYVNKLNPNKMLQGFTISRIAKKVSVFKPMSAKLLIDRYLSEHQTIYDPFSGFSGRLLGAIALNKTYMGSDISPIHVNESNKLLEFLTTIGIEMNASITCADIFNISGEYDCLFTCPPYANKEEWFEVSASNRPCDLWIEECLKRFKCKSYLFVVDNTLVFRDNIVEKLSSVSHFGNKTEYVVLIKS